MVRKIPAVRIKYAWLLSDSASVVMNEKWGDGTPLRSFKEYEKIASKYEQWWQPYNDKIIKGICEILDLEFRQNIIDVYVAPWFNAISDPMVIGPALHNEDDLINTLAHEMLHRLLTDNTTYDYDYDLLTQWHGLFGQDHSMTALVHIPVHAAMEALYVDVLDRPDLLALDIKETSSYKPYANAWKYVKKVGYKKIINQLLAESKQMKDKAKKT